MSQPFNETLLCRRAWSDFRRAWAPLVAFEAGFKLLEAWLLIPAVAALFSAVIARSGSVAVSNHDILDFLLSPAGLAYVALFSSAAVALLLLEQAGIMGIASLGSRRQVSIRAGLTHALRLSMRLIQLGAVQALLLAAVLVPFVVLAAATYVLFLSQHDIYFYLTQRPPAFWWAAAIGGLLLAAALFVGGWLYVRWSLAVPILLFERQYGSDALRASRDRVRGMRWLAARLLLGWLAVSLLLSLIVMSAFRFSAGLALATGGEYPILRIVALLVIQAALLAGLSFLTVVGLGLLTRQLYLHRSEQLGVVQSDANETADEFDFDSSRPPAPAAQWPRRVAWAAIALALIAPLVVWFALPRQLAKLPRVQVTAHRGNAAAAPENTLAAVRKAIEVGADYVEIDVQLTTDGRIVLLHDRDFKRVSSDSRRLEDLTAEQVAAMDVGRWFSPDFAGERVPTLADVIDAVRGKVRLNIEMKFFGPNRRLAREVALLVREKEFEQECIVTSLNYDGLLEARRHNPQLRIGLIVGYALGDISRLEVDALSVQLDFLSDSVFRSARRLGREVHVWGVSDSRQAKQMMKRGVDNIIAKDPESMVRLRDEWLEMSDAERLLLSSRLLLGLPP